MKCDTIETKYDFLCKKESDINEHLPTLKKYSEGLETVIEFGVRRIVSTWAFLAGKPKKVISYDLYHPSVFGADLDEVIVAAQQCGIGFDFVQGDTRQITIPECDFLFIDTLHEYHQTRAELFRHAKNVKKYIGFHDTVTFCQTGEGGGLGICHAIEEFLVSHKEWRVKEEFKNNNGLTIIERI